MIIIVGAGLAGLACATRLEEFGEDWLLLESSDVPGGRVATEVTPEGFRLDRGFQVLLDSYPTARKLLNFEVLRPRYFESGALLADENGWERFLNPLRRWDWSLSALFGKTFSLSEKLTLGAYAARQLLRSDGSLLESPCGRSTLVELQQLGLDGRILESFLRPFFAGVFLDNDLGTDASIFRYDLKKFVLGRALLPAGGMGEIPRQLASRLPGQRIRYRSAVVSLRCSGERVTHVMLENGEEIACDQLVLATEEWATRHLLGLDHGRNWSGVSTLYFEGEEALYEGGLLVLPCGKSRLVRHFTDLTNTAPEYAPVGKRLLSATVLHPLSGNMDGLDLVSRAKAEITGLLPDFRSWRFLKEVRISCALPSQSQGYPGMLLSRRVLPNLVLAGDQVAPASIESALVSGLAAADDLCTR